MGNLLKRLKTNIMISALLCVVLGIVLVVWPDLSMKIVCIAVGAALLIGGGVRLAVFFTQTDKVLAIIPIIVGIVIVLHGVNDLQQAVTLYKGQYDKWWVALILGLLTAGFGILLICKPFAALDTVVMLIGTFLIYDGLSDIWIVSRVYRTAKAMKQEAEALDVEAEEVE